MVYYIFDGFFLAFFSSFYFLSCGCCTPMKKNISNLDGFPGRVVNKSVAPKQDLTRLEQSMERNQI